MSSSKKEKGSIVMKIAGFSIIIALIVLIIFVIKTDWDKSTNNKGSHKDDPDVTVMPELTVTSAPTATLKPTPTLEPTPTSTPVPTPTATPSPSPSPSPTASPSPSPTATPSPSPTATPTPSEDKEGRPSEAGGTLFGFGEGKLICIDPGHQVKGNYSEEPIGPGASETKPKVSSGTAGVKTRLPEYKLNLTISMQLKDELVARGYRVVMTRTVHEIDITNIERATIANENLADAFVRIHANGADSSSVKGIETICQTPQNKYNGDIYPQCRLLSDCVLDCLVDSTGGIKRYVWETDTMSGINWSKVPVTIVEMGYMSNPEEDVLLSDPDYQQLIVKGIADGIDRFFS